MAYLILVRHGKSEWNEKGLWTGFTDIPLCETGREEACRTAETLKDLPKIDIAYTSLLSRAKETLEILLKGLNLNIPVYENFALNERDYGVYTGKNKWEVQKAVGNETFEKIRRAWDYPVPKGESLKQVFARVIPYYEHEILPQLAAGKNVLIAASGNSLRALIKFLEKIPDEKIADVEIGTGEAWVYTVSPNGGLLSKEIRAKNDTKV